MRNVNGLIRVGVILMMGVLAGAVRPAQGTLHFWTIKEVYTNADGTIQFIELFTSSDGQQATSLARIESIKDIDIKNTFFFGSNTPFPTAGHHLLLVSF